MADDHAQRTLEQKALANVRARLDRPDSDGPVRSVGEAAAHVAKTLSIVVAGLVLVGGLAIAALGWLFPRAPLPAKSREMYAVGVLQQAESFANQQRRSSRFDGLRGNTQVAFTVGPGGYVEARGVDVLQSSGDRRVDEAARDLPLAAQPFGRFHARADPTPLAIRGTVMFGDHAIMFRLDP